VKGLRFEEFERFDVWSLRFEGFDVDV